MWIRIRTVGDPQIQGVKDHRENAKKVLKAEEAEKIK